MSQQTLQLKKRERVQTPHGPGTVIHINHCVKIVRLDNGAKTSIPR